MNPEILFTKICSYLKFIGCQILGTIFALEVKINADVRFAVSLRWVEISALAGDWHCAKSRQNIPLGEKRNTEIAKWRELIFFPFRWHYTNVIERLKFSVLLNISVLLFFRISSLFILFCLFSFSPITYYRKFYVKSGYIS